MRRKEREKMVALEQRFQSLESQVLDITRAVVRNITIESERVRNCRINLEDKKKILSNLEGKKVHLRETKDHIERNLRTAGKRVENSKKSNDDLKKDFLNIRKEEEKVAKKCNRERQMLTEKLALYKRKWEERYELRYSNKPMVKELEKAKKLQADLVEQLKLLRSDLRDCQADVFKAKCERGKRNAEESGFYPIGSFLVRLAKLWLEVKSSEKEEIYLENDISKLVRNIACENIKIQSKLRAEELERCTSEIGQSNSLESHIQKFHGRNLSLSETNFKEKYKRDELNSKASDSKSTGFKTGSDHLYTPKAKYAVQEKSVRNRMEKLKIYTPKLSTPTIFITPPSNDDHLFFPSSNQQGAFEKYKDSRKISPKAQKLAHNDLAENIECNNIYKTTSEEEASSLVNCDSSTAGFTRTNSNYTGKNSLQSDRDQIVQALNTPKIIQNFQPDKSVGSTHSSKSFEPTTTTIGNLVNDPANIQKTTSDQQQIRGCEAVISYGVTSEFEEMDTNECTEKKKGNISQNMYTTPPESFEKHNRENECIQELPPIETRHIKNIAEESSKNSKTQKILQVTDNIIENIRVEFKKNAKITDPTPTVINIETTNEEGKSYKVSESSNTLLKSPAMTATNELYLDQEITSEPDGSCYEISKCGGNNETEDIRMQIMEPSTTASNDWKCRPKDVSHYFSHTENQDSKTRLSKLDSEMEVDKEDNLQNLEIAETSSARKSNEEKLQLKPLPVNMDTDVVQNVKSDAVLGDPLAKSPSYFQSPAGSDLFTQREGSRLKSSLFSPTVISPTQRSTRVSPMNLPLQESKTSPFDFEKHMKAIQELKQSPDFTYQSRLMYGQKDAGMQTKEVTKEQQTGPPFNTMVYFNTSYPAGVQSEKHLQSNLNTVKMQDTPQVPRRSIPFDTATYFTPLNPEKSPRSVKSKEDEPEYLSFAFEDYLSDSPPSHHDGQEKSMFSFNSPKSGDDKSPSGFFPLFAADDKAKEEDNGDPNFTLQFGKQSKYPQVDSGFKLMF